MSEISYEDCIRLIAYQKWEEDNYTHGKDQEHWFQAEEEMKNMIDQNVGSIVKSISKSVSEEKTSKKPSKMAAKASTRK